MKKNILLLAVLLAFIPAVSFAEYDTGVVTLGKDPNELEISTSNQVFIDYKAEGSGVTYAIVTSHDKGDRTYMSSSEDATIYYGNGKKLAVPDAPTHVGSGIGSGDKFDKTL